MGDFIFGIGPWTPSAGEVCAHFASKKLAAKTAVTFHVNDPWSELVNNYFENEFKKLGGKIIQRFAFNPQDQDFRAAIAKVRVMKPDVIYSPISDNIIPFYQQLHQANVSHTRIITSDIIADDHIRQAPAAFDGIFQSQIKDPSSPDMEELASRYKRKFGRTVALPWYVATAYDGVNLIEHCITKVGVISSKIGECIAKVNGLPGVSQTISFNPGGSSPQIESIFRIEGGKFVLQESDRGARE